jgi:predicted DNA-binding transcriptional regulator YafY
MSKREAIIRLSLILRKLRSKACTFEEIYDFLMQEGEIQSYNFDISKRTFQRDLQDIASIFSIDIDYDFSNRKYYIAEEGPANDRLLEAFDTFSALNVRERMSDILLFEDRKPLGTDHLHGIMHAIKQQKLIKFSYSKYWEEGSTTRTLVPYAMKEFNHRWYVVGKDHIKQEIRIFGLDRIKDLQILKEGYEAANFSVQDYFKHCFGIIRPDDEKSAPEEVILSFNPFKGKYIKSLPLHHSQQLLVDNEEETRVSIKVYITHDLMMEILSHGHEVDVIGPIGLRKKVKDELESALKTY